MDNGLDINLIIAAIFGLIIVYVLFRLLTFPFRLFLSLISKAAVGAVILVIFNLLGAWWGISIGINPITILIAGILGAPGVLMMAVLQYLL